MIAIGLLFVRMRRDCLNPRQQREVEFLVLRHQKFWRLRRRSASRHGIGYMFLVRTIQHGAGI
jgi:hypothetical protein